VSLWSSVSSSASAAGQAGGRQAGLPSSTAAARTCPICRPGLLFPENQDAGLMSLTDLWHVIGFPMTCRDGCVLSPCW
jgi:hypothetical protein